MNRKSAVLTLSIGIACAIVAVALALDLGGISSVLPIAAKGVWGFAGCAAALLVCGAFALAHKPTPQQNHRAGRRAQCGHQRESGTVRLRGVLHACAFGGARAGTPSSRSARPACSRSSPSRS
mgnify:CR=1 FL=1